MKRLPIAVYVLVALASMAMAAAHTVDGTAARADLAASSIMLCSVVPASSHLAAEPQHHAPSERVQ